MNQDTITFMLPERMTTDNSADVESKIHEATGGDFSVDLVLDAGEMNYISSSGLRVLLKAGKKYRSLLIQNVNDELYGIFDVTGFSDILNIRRMPKKYSVEGCEVIGKGAKGAVYRYNADSIIKVYFNSTIEDIEKETSLAKKALVAGVPTAISFGTVMVGDDYGSYFELIDAQTVTQAIINEPDKLDYYVGIMVDLLKDIHDTNVSRFDFPDFRIEGHAWINGGIANVDELKARVISDMIDGMPERHTMIHGDFHSNNVMLQQGEPILIDMDRVSYGQPVFELCGVYMCYQGFSLVDHEAVKRFLGIDYDTARKVWDIFLKKYIGTDEPDKLREAEDKIALLTYARLIRRIYKGGRDLSEENMKLRKIYMEKIDELLPRVKTLVI
ncbi:MAG: phosphotransferase [Lachnospiraceae bacterium]|nr:phosphotransferase [Lachnospiraceae bacterium]